MTRRDHLVLIVSSIVGSDPMRYGQSPTEAISFNQVVNYAEQLLSEIEKRCPEPPPRYVVVNPEASQAALQDMVNRGELKLEPTNIIHPENSDSPPCFDDRILKDVGAKFF